MKKPSSTPSPRLASLDILRGFDLFLLVFFQPVLWTLAHQLNLPWLNSILFQFDHEVWEGFRFWDLVMPLFLFMTGASMPFSFSKFKDNPDKGPVYRKIIKRFILLFIFGMIRFCVSGRMGSSGAGEGDGLGVGLEGSGVGLGVGVGSGKSSIFLLKKF